MMLFIGICINVLFWFGYWLGWRDAKMDAEFDQNLEKLHGYALRGIRAQEIGEQGEGSATP